MNSTIKLVDQFAIGHNDLIDVQENVCFTARTGCLLADPAAIRITADLLVLFIAVIRDKPRRQNGLLGLDIDFLVRPNFIEHDFTDIQGGLIALNQEAIPRKCDCQILVKCIFCGRGGRIRLNILDKGPQIKLLAGQINDQTLILS